LAKRLPKTNNFDLIRLAAALQVAVLHLIGDLRGTALNWPVGAIVNLFPGVPIFFFISGFLISKSFEKNSVVKEFALNRFLRIYPGLAACFLVSLASVWLTGYFAEVNFSLSALLLWAAAQLSVAQFYNPDFMRDYGLGVLNGSTWTITVELQFYVLVPLMYGALRLQSVSRRRANMVLLGLILGFIAVNQAYAHVEAFHTRPFWFKLVGVSFAPWVYMFLVGVLCQRNYPVIQRWLAGRFIPLLIAYSALGLLTSNSLGWSVGNSLNPLLFVALSGVVFAAAFSANTLSDRVLRRNDVSYGVYIYHGPVINFLLATGFVAGWAGIPIAMASTFGLAYASWRLVEKPALGFKKHPLYQHPPAGVVARSRRG
jgi:peptidoglycan/LPS O-acetylase OafA/YrhL